MSIELKSAKEIRAVRETEIKLAWTLHDYRDKPELFQKVMTFWIIELG